MAIEIVDFPLKDGDFPVRYVTNYQRVLWFLMRRSSWHGGFQWEMKASLKWSPILWKWCGEVPGNGYRSPRVTLKTFGNADAPAYEVSLKKSWCPVPLEMGKTTLCQTVWGSDRIAFEFTHWNFPTSYLMVFSHQLGLVLPQPCEANWSFPRGWEAFGGKAEGAERGIHFVEDHPVPKQWI